MKYLALLCAGALSLVSLTSMAAGTLATTEEPDPMAGPKVEMEARPITIVRRDSAGHLVRLDTRPEVAAIDAMKLEPAEARTIKNLLEERFTAVGRITNANIDLFIKIQNARQSGAPMSEQRELIRELRPKIVELLEPSLSDTIAKALPEAKVKVFRGLLDEYLQALMQEPRPGQEGRGGQNAQPEPMAEAGPEAMTPRETTRRARPSDGRGPAPAAMQSGGRVPERMEINLVLREMARSLSSLVQERAQRTEELLKSVEATPEQEGKIREIVRSVGRGPEISESQRGEMMRQILQVLTPAQREKFMASRRQGQSKP